LRRGNPKPEKLK